jgi:hypothetical protein
VRFELLNEYLFDTATAFEFTHRCVDPSSPDGYGPELTGASSPQLKGPVSCPAAPVPGRGGSFTAQQNFLTEHNNGRDWKYYIWGYVSSLPGAPGVINYVRYTNEIPWGITNITTFFQSTATWGYTVKTSEWDDLTSWPQKAPGDCPTPSATWNTYPGAVQYRLIFSPGPGEVLGNFNSPPTVTGGQDPTDPCSNAAYRPAYTNPDNGVFTVLTNKACYVDPTITFTLIALDANNNFLATLTRVPI